MDYTLNALAEAYAERGAVINDLVRQINEIQEQAKVADQQNEKQQEQRDEQVNVRQGILQATLDKTERRFSKADTMIEQARSRLMSIFSGEVKDQSDMDKAVADAIDMLTWKDDPEPPADPSEAPDVSGASSQPPEEPDQAPTDEPMFAPKSESKS